MADGVSVEAKGIKEIMQMFNGLQKESIKIWYGEDFGKRLQSQC